MGFKLNVKNPGDVISFYSQSNFCSASISNFSHVDTVVKLGSILPFDFNDFARGVQYDISRQNVRD